MECQGALMSKTYKTDIEMHVRDDYGKLRILYVTADYTPGYPTRTCGHPDSCYPGEGAEIDILEVMENDLQLTSTEYAPFYDEIRDAIAEQEGRRREYNGD